MQWRLNDDDLEDDDDDYSKTSLDKKADAFFPCLDTIYVGTQCDIYTAISLIKTTPLNYIVPQTCLRQKEYHPCKF